MDIIKYVDAQRAFFNSGATKSYDFRLKALRDLKHAIVKYNDQIISALWQDLHKSAFESYATEIGIITGELDYAIRNLKKWMRTRHKHTPLVLFPATSKIVKQPYGVTLIISPWNYPFQLLLSPLVGAMAAGNCAVLKPSTAAPATTAILEKIISETFDQNYILLINGANEITNTLLQQHFDYIFYTGGLSYGKEVMAAAAQKLIPVTLELGGKSPCIVDKDANIAVAARRIVWGKFLNSGQTCVAPDYLMVHNEVKHDLIKYLKLEIVEQFGLDPKLSPDYPRIINQRQFSRLVAMIESGTLICGGESDADQLYIAPTLLDDVSLDSDIMSDEIFGPLLPIIGFNDIDTVIDFVNNGEKPLALYYFSQSKKRANNVINKTLSGGVCVNDVVIHVANEHIPFGGVGQSGLGSYHGRYSFETFSHSRSIMSVSTRINIGVKYAPYKDKIKLLKKIF